ncbi:MAG: substrate-binding periplasmic protein [Thalassospira sp.]|uniref:substrate-binding periplasmic protein n=1 Tax=Thalassospira sp. TaxID=1912094 RepID=UPI003A86D3DB
MGLKRVCKVLPLLAFAVFVGIGFTFENTHAQTRKPTDEDTRTEIRFAVAEWPPMVTETMANFGKHSHRVTEIFARMGYRVEFVFLSWPRAFELTRRGYYVGTFSWVRTEDREGAFLIPRYPIAEARQVGFYKKPRFPDGLDVDELEDIRDFGLRPVGVASYWHEEAFNNLGIEAEIVANTESAWRFLDAGRADILFEEEEVGWLDLTNILGAEVARTFATTAPVTTENMYILFSRNHVDGARLQQAYDDFMESEEGQEMCGRWSICETSHAQSPATRNDQ